MMPIELPPNAGELLVQLRSEATALLAHVDQLAACLSPQPGTPAAPWGEQMDDEPHHPAPKEQPNPAQDHPPEHPPHTPHPTPQPPPAASLIRSSDHSALLETVWHDAPIALRLRFLQALLPADHSRQAALREAVGLADLVGKETEFAAWIPRYPTVFADAVARAEDPQAEETDAPGLLTQSVLHTAAARVRDRFQTLGGDWVRPATGAAIGPEDAVIGDGPAEGIPPGRVARCVRPGLRWRGELLLPSQVLRSPAQTASSPPPGNAGILPASAPSPPRGSAGTLPASAPSPSPGNAGILPASAPAWASQTAQSDRTATAAGGEYSQEPLAGPAPPAALSPHSSPLVPPPGAPDRPAISPPTADPEWFRGLLLRSAAQTGVVATALDRLRALVEWVASHPGEEPNAAALAAWLEPLLPLLGPGGLLGTLPEEWVSTFLEVRPQLVEWLSETLGATLLAPAVREPVDPHSMEIVDERRTAHAHEEGTVARVERAGLAVRGAPALRARVVCYVRGEHQ